MISFEELIKGAERVRLTNQLLEEYSVEELRYLLKVIPMVIIEKEKETRK